MKRTKKIAGLMLGLAMMLSLFSTAFAAGSNTIKVTGAQKGETYQIFKMLDLRVNEEKTAYSYTVNSEWTDFFKEEKGGAGAAYVIIDDQGYVTWKEEKKTAAAMEAFGKAAAAYAETKGLASVVPQIKPTVDGDITFETLESGYYLVTSTNGTLAMVLTTPDDPDAVINEKNPDTTLKKEVQEDSTQDWGSENSAQIGDTVEFKVTIDAKKGAKNYVMHDKMEDGLTFRADSVAIVGLVKDTDYTVVTENLSDGCTFEIHFTQSYLDSLTIDKALTVTYDAVLNENADVTLGEKNDAMISWGDESKTEWSETVTKTYQFEILKYDAKDDTKKPLAGAVFQLKDDEGNVVKLIKITDTEYRVANSGESGAVEKFTTVADGKIVIKGVDLDEYTLVEITAPAGYNKLHEDLTFTVESDNTLTVEIPNQSGVELPSTGGMGTTIFYVLGGILAAVSFVLLFTKKRMNKRNG